MKIQDTSLRSFSESEEDNLRHNISSPHTISVGWRHQMNKETIDKLVHSQDIDVRLWYKKAQVI